MQWNNQIIFEGRKGIDGVWEPKAFSVPRSLKAWNPNKGDSAATVLGCESHAPSDPDCSDPIWGHSRHVRFPSNKKKESTCPRPPPKTTFFGKSLEAENLDSDRDRFMMQPNWFLVLPKSCIVVASTFPIKYYYKYSTFFYPLPDSTARTTSPSSAMLFPSGTGSTWGTSCLRGHPSRYPSPESSYPGWASNFKKILIDFQSRFAKSNISLFLTSCFITKTYLPSHLFPFFEQTFLKKKSFVALLLGSRRHV